jgi:hypothetical protein
MHSSELMSILQATLSPVILISGAGLLILSMTNRFGRVVDRSRQLGDALRIAPQVERKRLAAQLVILDRRARILRLAISFAAMSVLLVAILVIALFLTALLHVDAVLLSAILVIVCLVSLIISLLAFLQDINLSLSALKLDLARKDEPAA